MDLITKREKLVDVNIIYVIAVIAVGVFTLLASLLTTWINKKSSEKMKLIELTHHDKKLALAQLYGIGSKEYSSLDDLENEIISFVNTLESAYVPQKIMNRIFHDITDKTKIDEKTKIHMVRNLITDYISELEK